MSQLSEHFTTKEWEFSITAIRNQIPNTIPPELIPSAQAVCQFILEPLRVNVGIPIGMDSGYRCLVLNRLIKSKDDSQHVLAEAADIRIKGMTPQQVCDRIVALNLPFDQLIEEYGEWTHVSYGPRNRRQKLHSRHGVDGNPVYTPMI
jgi:zinc D-Ala-D-Ala carboxypeptidase